MTAQAGWYVDPRDSNQYRYWDGERWSQSTQPIPSENTGLASSDAATSTLAAGGTAEPIGADAFGAAGVAGAAAAGAAGVAGAAAAGDAPADLMWTAGFGDDATSSRSGAEMFSPDEGNGAVGASPWQPDAPAVPSAPAAPTVPSEPIVSSEPPAQPSAFTPSAPEGSASGGPMFIRDTGSDPAFTPVAPAEAPTPVAPAAGGQEPAEKVSKLDQYTMAAGQVPEDRPSTSKRPSRRKRGDAGDAAAVATGAAAGATLAGGVDGPPRKRRKSTADETPPTAPTKSSGSLPPGAKPVKGGQTSRLPLLLGVLGVVVVGAAAFLFLRGGDDEGGDVATETPETTAAATETTAPVPTEPPATEPSAPASTDPVMTSQLEASFAAEVTRACDVIKADPGLLTESVIQYDQQWDALGRTYEDLQRAVNECSQPARDEALRRVAEASGGA